MDVLAGRRKLSHGLDNHVGAARGGVPYRDAGGKQHKIYKLAASVHWQTLYLALLDDGTYAGARRFHLFRKFLHLYLLCHLAQQEVKNLPRVGPDLQDHILACFLKAGGPLPSPCIDPPAGARFGSLHSHL